MIPNLIVLDTSKRPLDPATPENPSKRSRAKRRRYSKNPIAAIDNSQLVAKVIIINQHEEVAKNVAWLNHNDYVQLFSTIPANTEDGVQSRHIQIANRVYQVAIKSWLDSGSIALTPRQFDDIKDKHGVFTIDGSNAIQISAYSPEVAQQNILHSVVFDLEPNDDFGSNTTPKSIDLFELRTAVSECLRGKYILPSQVLYIERTIGRFKLTVKETTSVANMVLIDFENAKPRSPFGLINQFTNLDFQVKGHPDVSIVNQEVQDKDAKFSFTLSLTDIIDKNDPVPLPLKLDYDKVLADLKKILSDRSVIVGHKYTYKYDNWNLVVKFDKVITDKPQKPLDNITKKYETSYRVQDSTKMEVNTSKDLVLTRGNPFKASSADFEIISVTETNPLTSSCLWLNVEVIKKSLSQLSESIVKGQRFHLKFPEVKLVVELKKARPAIGLIKFNSQKKTWKKQWVLDPNAEISLKKGWGVKWSLIENNKAVDLTEVTLKINTSGSTVFTATEKDLEDAVRKMLSEGVVIDQYFTSEVKGQKIEFAVSAVDYPDKDKLKLKYGVLGKMLPETKIKFLNESEDMAITSKTSSKDPVKHLEEMGFGGLSEQGKKIIRKVVNERRSPMKEEIEKRGLQPSKGLLLYGPPGTGKTLLARCLGSILGCDNDHVQLISGTKVFSKWVGESEQRVRDLFLPALEAAKKFKNDSEVFLVIIDEIDGILSHRAGDNNKWRDTVVNEFLAQMDGLEQFHNIIIVGMTNRLKELDEAVVRSGRFGDKVEIGMPDEKGRRQILEIHTREMKKKNLLKADIDFDAVAAKTKGFSGADIRGLVKSAADYAVNRLSEMAYKGENIVDRPEGITTMADFEAAIKEMTKTEEMSIELRMFYGR